MIQTWRLEYLLVGVLLLQHDGQPLQEGPHAGRHVQAHDALLLQCRAARGQHVVGRHELLGAVYNQHILDKKQTREQINTKFGAAAGSVNRTETSHLRPVGADGDAHIWDPDYVLDRS